MSWLPPFAASRAAHVAELAKGERSAREQQYHKNGPAKADLIEVPEGEHTSTEPANSAGRLIARSITTPEDRLWRPSSSASANSCMNAMNGWTRPRWSPLGIPRRSHQMVG